MASIAYIDHSFHQNTLSSAFLPDLLRNRGHTVDIFWDHAWKGGESVPLRKLTSYDALILFQATGYFSGWLCDVHKNITFVPMLDGYGITFGRAVPQAYWQDFAGVKILNFSKTLHYINTANSLVSRYYQYFQQPLPEPLAPSEGLHGFFWCRKPDDISWEHLRRLIGDTRFDSFHLHLVPDPGQPAPPYPTNKEIIRHNITITTNWFADNAEFQKVRARANVFFTPRLEEGIGQATLESFSYGQCVVAPDSGTMNEYILDGINGLLYAHAKLAPLSFEEAVALGRRGWESAMSGYKRWRAAEQNLEEYILTPSKICYEQAALLITRPWLERARKHSSLQRCKSAMRPLIRFLRGSKAPDGK